MSVPNERLRELVARIPVVPMWSHQQNKWTFDGKLYEDGHQADHLYCVALARWADDVAALASQEPPAALEAELARPGPPRDLLRDALCEALDCIMENIDIPGTEWADRPMKEWEARWRAALNESVLTASVTF
jgi:hypothetical protein